MKKYILVFVMLFALQSYAQKDENIFELKPSESTAITGKSAGEDAAVNPYKDGNSIAIVKNLGKNSFTIRVEYQEEVVQSRVLKAGKATMIPLRQGSELYIDSKLESKAKVDFKKGSN